MSVRLALSLCILCALLYSAVGFTRMISSDLVYFPDQADYIKRATKCSDRQILWPGNGRCYVEGERGPCNVGRVLVLDKRDGKTDGKFVFYSRKEFLVDLVEWRWLY